MGATITCNYLGATLRLPWYFFNYKPPSHFSNTYMKREELNFSKHCSYRKRGSSEY